MSPLNKANATIGRAWTLLSRNLGGGAIPGQTYLGSQGNNLNYNNICFPEREDKLPAGWKPLSEQKGFKHGESAVSTFTGWEIVHGALGMASNKEGLARVVSRYSRRVSPGNSWIQSWLMIIRSSEDSKPRRHSVNGS
jgi:hypothetical protein